MDTWQNGTAGQAITTVAVLIPSGRSRGSCAALLAVCENPRMAQRAGIVSEPWPLQQRRQHHQISPLILRTTINQSVQTVGASVRHFDCNGWKVLVTGHALCDIRKSRMGFQAGFDMPGRCKGHNEKAKLEETARCVIWFCCHRGNTFAACLASVWAACKP